DATTLQFQVSMPNDCWVLHTAAPTERRVQGHNRSTATVHKLLRHDEVACEIRQHREALADEHARGFERLLVVGEERHLVADDFELDEVGLQSLAGQPRGSYRLLRGVAPGGVRYDGQLRAEVL